MPAMMTGSWWLAILAAALVAFAIGGMWYSRPFSAADGSRSMGLRNRN
jgi:hypothetical protein